MISVSNILFKFESIQVAINLVSKIRRYNNIYNSNKYKFSKYFSLNKRFPIYVPPRCL